MACDEVEGLWTTGPGRHALTVHLRGLMEEPLRPVMAISSEVTLTSSSWLVSTNIGLHSGFGLLVFFALDPTFWFEVLASPNTKPETVASDKNQGYIDHVCWHFGGPGRGTCSSPVVDASAQRLCPKDPLHKRML